MSCRRTSCTQDKRDAGTKRSAAEYDGEMTAAYADAQAALLFFRSTSPGDIARATVAERNGNADEATMDEARRRIIEQYAPRLADVRGFVNYYGMTARDAKGRKEREEEVVAIERAKALFGASAQSTRPLRAENATVTVEGAELQRILATKVLTQ